MRTPVRLILSNTILTTLLPASTRSQSPNGLHSLRSAHPTHVSDFLPHFLSMSFLHFVLGASIFNRELTHKQGRLSQSIYLILGNIQSSTYT